jgi:hypothetical protein
MKKKAIRLKAERRIKKKRIPPHAVTSLGG